MTAKMTVVIDDKVNKLATELLKEIFRVSEENAHGNPSQLITNYYVATSKLAMKILESSEIMSQKVIDKIREMEESK